jgi:hypothetical protein
MNNKRLKKADWYVADVNLKTAKEFIIEHHYAKGCSNTRVYSHGLFNKTNNDLHGVAIWLPPTKIAAESVNKDCWKEVLSLSRLACRPDSPKNAASFLIANSIKLIQKDGRFSSLVTYADTRMGHTGAIYKATNWTYVGMTRSTPTWIDPQTGKQVAIKATKTRTAQQMIDLGYERIGTFKKHKFVMHLK